MSPSDFAAAHQRVLDRRHQQHQDVSPKSSLLARLPAFLSVPLSFANLNSALSGVLSRYGTSPSFRVSQLDSELLDAELLDLLKTQVSDVLKYYSSHLLDDYTSEVSLILRAILFKLSIWDHNASYGASLQNLHYTDARARSPIPPTRWQKSLYGLLSIGGPYAWSKWQDRLLTLTDPADYESDQDTPASRQSRYLPLLDSLTTRLSTLHSLATFTSFTLFLLNGRYRTILDRILRLRLTPKTSQLSREVSFEYLNRQLVWHAFTEFLLFLLPLVGIARWRRWLSRAWRRAGAVFRAQDLEGNGEKKDDSGILAFLPERTCAICYQDQNNSPGADMGGGGSTGMGSLGSGSGVVGSAQTDVTNAYETVECGHIYCFVCLAQRLEAEEGDGWVCLRCGELVTRAKAWNGDVLDIMDDNSTQHSSETGMEESSANYEKQTKTRVVSPSTSPRSSMSRGSKASSPSKSVSFALDHEEKKKDLENHEHQEEHGEISIIDPMPIEDEIEVEGSVTTADDIDVNDITSSLMESADWDDTIESAQSSLLMDAEEQEE